MRAARVCTCKGAGQLEMSGTDKHKCGRVLHCLCLLCFCCWFLLLIPAAGILPSPQLTHSDACDYDDDDGAADGVCRAGVTSLSICAYIHSAQGQWQGE